MSSLSNDVDMIGPAHAAEIALHRWHVSGCREIVQRPMSMDGLKPAWCSNAMQHFTIP